MSPWSAIRLAPGGSGIPLAALWRAVGTTDPGSRLDVALRAHFPRGEVRYYHSGREAMRATFAALAARSGRDEVALPAYGCFSMPASAVAAGLRVRLVDVDERGQLADEAVRRLPFERLAAVVVGNLFGVPEPVVTVCEQARAQGAAVIDDAAQALGARSKSDAVGSRGDVGILSFGRGKPLSALGGGAAVWLADARPGLDGAAVEPPRRGEALLRGLVYDLSRQPLLLRWLASIPALEIGVTHFDPGFVQGPLSGAAVVLAAALWPELGRLNAARHARAHALAAALRARTEFVPLLEDEGDTGVFPRLGLRAPSAARRDRALVALAPLGATAMYPTTLCAIPALARHLVGSPEMPGAEDFVGRLLTLPTHAGIHADRIERIARVLEAV